MLLTDRAYFLLVVVGLVGAVFFGLSPASSRWQVAALALVVGNLAVLGLAVIDVLTIDRVKVRRSIAPRLSIGKPNPVEVTIETASQPCYVEIRDSYPPQFSVSRDTLQLQLGARVRYELGYTIRPDRRGLFTWGDIYVRQRGRWGLAFSQWTVPARQEVAVYPDLVSLKALTIKLAMEAGGAIRQKRRWGIGTEFAELREYRLGDDTRLIDWKATARRNRPLVRVLEPEQEQTLIILLDRGRLMTARVAGLTRFDHGLNALLALALAGLHRGDRVGVGVFDRDMYCWLPPERGQHRLGKIMEQLTAIEPQLLEPDYMTAVGKVVQQQTRRALVVMLTDIIDETASAELLTAMTHLTPRYLPFCVTLRDPEVDRLAHTFPDPASADRIPIAIKDAFNRAVALDLLDQRELAFAKLRQHGVLVLDAPAHQVSQPLVDRYLQLKQRSLL
ncbi:MAG: DUF58 domain-containing protein [Pseudanabaenaceae cyanobacterium SKYGB_i_bin29]|nr:DUF58 domain-containing protein [Pseudanabaenaceae cyanobacterium SKYG29]MDW8420668.1 DUF58 domain-containing protein [Pseudanabaenaceae cyanobacterium SKYGB_i_bin29]